MPTLPITIEVLGLDPAPQGSKSYLGHGRMVESSKRVKPWRAAIAEACRGHEQINEPCEVELWLRFKRPASHLRSNGEVKTAAPTCYIVKRNDIDKCARSSLDGLVQGGLLRDDCLVIALHVEQRYAELHEQPGAIIQITT